MTRGLAAEEPQPVDIAVDAMSGDRGHEVAVAAAVRALQRNPELRIALVGDEPILRAELSGRAESAGRVTVVPASQVVSMDEPPAQAFRHKQDSSMRVAVERVARGEAQACVSAGNTGALMATAKLVLDMLPGVERPAIMSALPAHGGPTYMLDLGANVACTPQQLLQFATMGSALVAAVDGIARPRVALLNVGEETIKGNALVKEAAALLEVAPLNFVGSIEGDRLFMEPVDVVVCDGFTGNVALKVGEGVVRLTSSFMREEFQRTWCARMLGLAARRVLHRLGQRLDPRSYNGASLLGLRGTVVKSHGNADAIAFCNAIEVAAREARHQIPRLIERLLADQLLAAAPAPSE